MPAGLAERPMNAKKRSDATPYVSVKLPADVMESARIVAAYRGEAIAEMLGAILRPVLTKMEREEAHRRAKKTDGGAK